MDEILGLLLLAIGVIFLLSVLSYHPEDPSWNVLTSRSSVQNKVGRVGAYLADFWLQMLGLAAFGVPALLFGWAWAKLRSRPLRAPLMKGLGWMGVLLAGAGFLSVLFPKDYVVWPTVRPGGMLGTMVATQLVAILNTVGAALVLGVTLLLALMTVGNFSIIAAGEAAIRAIRHLVARSPKPIEPAPETPTPSTPGSTSTPKPKIVAWDTLDFAKSATASERPAPPEERATEPALSLSEAELEAKLRTRSPVPPVPVDVEEIIERRDPSPIPTARRERGEPARQAVADPIAEMLSTASVRSAKQVEKASPTERSGVMNRSGRFQLPSTEMLIEPPPPHEQAHDELMQRAVLLAEKFKEFGITGHVHQISPGPVVTTFEFKPDPGIKYSRIVSLVEDLCLALEAESIRIDRIPGKSTIGIEVPNKHRELIRLREIIESKKFQESRSRLTIALGKTIDGGVYISDLAKMPHLLIAGATGSGKSMTVNCILASILFKATPEEARFILIDPKRLELGLYDGIPHLLAPIVTDPKRAAYALKWAVAEMENRYKLLASFGVRNIEQFNREIRDLTDRSFALGSGESARPLPYIVIIIDELADLMMVASSEVEAAITRLAQMARAVGIHLVLTTQRPSVDVITGLIKANFPCRIAFRVSSKVDSRTILDTNGAEALLGRGDMLFLPPGSSRLVRVHGAFLEETEIKRLVEFLKAQGAPQYDETVLMSDKEYAAAQSGGEKRDELYEEALKIVVEMGRASTSVLQRRLRIGYGRAASIIDMMEREGYVEPADGPRPRAITRKALEFRERLREMEAER
ncbi:MAG: DNA translocase FtsK [Blastocatellia bacterium]|nr:DNA translocase FtsK [Blastocatellia bacterium]MCX7752911.1 DNA translocase FtsK [Blastocatellia bacterium]MDW8167967.1 DNA translocase FtsK [Acidobacteriota bacterium]MDW8256342.1 DNA translocase FtsK [Acidobacteriota bacterium]